MHGPPLKVHPFMTQKLSKFWKIVNFFNEFQGNHFCSKTDLGGYWMRP